MIVLFNILCLYLAPFTAADNADTPDNNAGNQTLCLLPRSPEHGTYSSSPAASPGDTVDSFQLNVTCNKGYKLTRVGNVSCSNGVWAGSMPQCDAFCIPKNRVPDSFSRCVFDSGEIYSIDGVSLSQRRRLSGTNETSIHCDYPPFPKNAAFAKTIHLSPGEAVQKFEFIVVCEPNFHLAGPSIIECHFGTLTNLPECLVPCAPLDGGGAKVLLCEDLLASSDISNTSSIAADADSSDKKTDSSNKTLCLLPRPPEHGTYTSLPVASPGDAVDSFQLNLTCHRGYKLTGVGNVNCSNGMWAGSVPQCDEFCIPKSRVPDSFSRCVFASGEIYNKDEYNAATEAVDSEPETNETSKRCKFPSFPKNAINAKTIDVSTNEAVQKFEFIVVCEPKFLLVGPSIIECSSGKLTDLPECLAPCAPLDDGGAEILQCEDLLASPDTILVNKASSETSVGTNNLQDCVLPPYPQNGWYHSYPERPPGTTVGTFQLNVTCDPGYHLIGERNVYCIFGLMEKDMPTCLQYCKVDQQTTVIYGEDEPQCVLSTADELLLRTGSTHKNSDRGLLECGTVENTRRRRLPVSGGFVAKPKEFPWHAGIYRTSSSLNEQICGGTLIAKSVVISAAHCFTDSRKTPSPSIYGVAVGKVYREWGFASDDRSQESAVKRIKIPPRYQGALANFQEDIALVITVEEFSYSRFVKPACISFDSKFDEEQLQHGNLGKIAGWGLTDEVSPASEVLQAARIPYISIERCIRTSPMSFRSSITGDKICAGYYNGTSACRGDSGGGFVMATEEDNIERYYLHGVISTSPVNGKDCNIYTWITFTHILRHENFIKSVLL